MDLGRNGLKKMDRKPLFETQRLLVRELDLNDSDFILKLVNTPTWLEFIGDKGVTTIEGAKNYLINGPLKSYQENGYGLWLIQLKTSDTPIGMCGIINRSILEYPDIGFALLPEYSNKGYGYEMANATMQFAKNHLQLSTIVAITDPQNKASIKLLTKIGLQFKKVLKLSKEDTVLLFTDPSSKDQIGNL